MLSFFPKPKFAFAEQYANACNEKNLRYVWYFSLFGSLIFGFHLIHHFRFGYGVFTAPLLPYTLLYTLGIIIQLVNMLILYKFKSHHRLVNSIELLFPIFIAVIAVALSYFSAHANQGVTPFAIMSVIMCFTIQGHFVLICTSIFISFVSLSILLIGYSNNVDYSPLVAVSLTTAISCIVIAYITENMRIQQFELVIALNNNNQQLKFLSLQDHLSGLLNRRAIDEILSKEMSRSIRFKHPLTVFLIDIDNFKQINDCHGHVVGDAVIKNVANNIKTHTRLDDYVGRIGGDEFIVILIESDKDNSMQAADRIRKEVASQKYKSKDLRVTVSIGLAVSDGRPAEAFMQQADEALYVAKRKGKNVVSFDTESTDIL